jgi:hypothetical protein
VLNIFTKVSEDNRDIVLDEVTGLVANATGLSKASVYHARKDDGKIVNPKKFRKAK